MRNAGLPSVAFMVDATLEPIDVKRVCQAFGWPEFGGRVGGTFSKLRMRDGVITLGTTLRAQVFDWQCRVQRSAAAAAVRAMAALLFQRRVRESGPGAHDRRVLFGRITGKLVRPRRRLAAVQLGAGRVRREALHAAGRSLATPHQSARSRNIGSIGGGGAGVTAALSSGFLRFFDDFNYERLGLSCRLENDVCAMEGVAPAPNGGYYLVKGRGLPRIDVIGSSRRVDWPRLMQQLIAATHGPAARSCSDRELQ